MRCVGDFVGSSFSLPPGRKAPPRGRMRRKSPLPKPSPEGKAYERASGDPKKRKNRLPAEQSTGKRFFVEKSVGQLLLQPGLQLRNGHSYLRSHKRRRLWGPKADFKSSGGVNPPSGEILAAPKYSGPAAARRSMEQGETRQLSRPASPPARPSAGRWALLPAPWYPGPGW